MPWITPPFTWLRAVKRVDDAAAVVHGHDLLHAHDAGLRRPRPPARTGSRPCQRNGELPVAVSCRPLHASVRPCRSGRRRLAKGALLPARPVEDAVPPLDGARRRRPTRAPAGPRGTPWPAWPRHARPGQSRGSWCCRRCRVLRAGGCRRCARQRGRDVGAQLLGREHRHHGADARAEVLHAVLDDDAAVRRPACMSTAYAAGASGLPPAACRAAHAALDRGHDPSRAPCGGSSPRPMRSAPMRHCTWRMGCGSFLMRTASGSMPISCA